MRDLHLLAMLKRAVKSQPEDVAAVLNDVIETAENVDTARMRKESLAAIEELKQKGPNSKRELTGWGQVGQGALSMGCVVAAATGQIELGIPCVVGGAAYSAGLQYIRTSTNGHLRARRAKRMQNTTAIGGRVRVGGRRYTCCHRTHHAIVRSSLRAIR